MSINQETKTGYFCWADIGSDNYEEQTAFYEALFDWRVDLKTEVPARYGVGSFDGHDVAAFYQKMPGILPEDLAPVWTVYLRVADVAATTAHAERLGGSIVLPVYEIPGTGAMSIIRDPEGAHFALWEPRGHQGFELVDEPGTPTWFELNTRNTEESAVFYAELFEWEYVTQELNGARYTMFERDDDIPIAGMLEMGDDWGEAPPHWMLYFEVEDCDASAARVTELGGKICVPPTDLPYGRFAVVSDPTGGTFSIVVPNA